MACWPANVVGAFFVALIIFDLSRGDWVDLPFHGIVGIIMTGLFYLICMIVGESVSAAILVIPAVFMTISVLTLWFASQSLKNQRCCMTCKGPAKCQPPAPPPPPPKKNKCI